jgi:hypothetical protein
MDSANKTLSIMTFGMSISCHYAECHYAECNYAECQYAECQYAECCDTPAWPILDLEWVQTQLKHSGNTLKY